MEETNIFDTYNEKNHMSHWCYTKIDININDSDKEKKKIKKLFNLLDNWMHNEDNNTNFKGTWLGDIIRLSKIGTVNTNLDTDLKCEGCLTEIELDESETTMFLVTETVNEPILKLWKKLINKYLPTAEIIYTAEEYNTELYLTNETYLIDKYYIDVWDNEELPVLIESNIEATKEEVIDILKKLLQTEENEINTLLDNLRKSKYGPDLLIHHWKFKNLDECN